MTDLTNEQVVERCRTYWLDSGIDADAVADMALELRSHLQEATGEGKTIESAMAFTSTDAYQDIYAELESLGGIEERAAGVVHDLNDAFDRVNAGYFEGRMSRPRLTWNRSFTS